MNKNENTNEEITKKVAEALETLNGKGARDVIQAHNTARRACRRWIEKELCRDGVFDMDTVCGYAAAFQAGKSEAAMLDIIGEKTPNVAARRLVQSIAIEEATDDIEKAKKAVAEAVSAAKRYCYSVKHSRGAFGVFKDTLNASMPDIDALDEWVMEAEEEVNEYVLNLLNL